jgi:hypothetical protein
VGKPRLGTVPGALLRQQPLGHHLAVPEIIDQPLELEAKLSWLMVTTESAACYREFTRYSIPQSLAIDLGEGANTEQINQWQQIRLASPQNVPQEIRHLSGQRGSGWLRHG